MDFYAKGTFPTPTVFVSPTGVDGGTGTELDPFTSLVTLAANLPPAGSVIGFETGTEEVIFSEPTGTEFVLLLDQPENAHYTFVPYGDLELPLCKISYYSVLDTAGEWTEFDPDDGLNADGTPVTTASGTNFWVYNNGGNLNKTINWIGFGTIDSIETYRSEANVKTLLRKTAEHCEQNWLNPDGTILDDEYRLQAQWQWNSQAKFLVVYSVGNPITVAGGEIYIAGRFDAVFALRQPATFRYACSFYGCGIGVSVNNQLAQELDTLTVNVEGVFAEHCFNALSVNSSEGTDYLNPPGSGSVFQPVGAPYNDFTKLEDAPWTEIRVKDVEGYWMSQAVVRIIGWIEGSIENIKGRDCNTMGNWAGVVLTGVNARDEKKLRLSNIDIERVYPVGRFAYSDAAIIDCDMNVSNVIIDGIRGRLSYYGIQYDAARPGIEIYNADIRDCARAFNVGDQGDGGTSIKVYDSYFEASEFGSWASLQDANETVPRECALLIGIRVGLPHAGPDNGNGYTYPEDLPLRMYRSKLAAPKNSAFVIDKTTNEIDLEGPWHDANSDGIANNGRAVPPGTQQIGQPAQYEFFDVEFVGEGIPYLDAYGKRILSKEVIEQVVETPLPKVPVDSRGGRIIDESRAVSTKAVMTASPPLTPVLLYKIYNAATDSVAAGASVLVDNITTWTFREGIGTAGYRYIWAKLRAAPATDIIAVGLSVNGRSAADDARRLTLAETNLTNLAFLVGSGESLALEFSEDIRRISVIGYNDGGTGNTNDILELWVM